MATAEPLTRRGLPTDPTLRVLAAATLVNTSGNGAIMTTAVLYFTLTAGLPVWLAVTLLLAGAATHTVGEMVGSGGQWGVQMGLAPQQRQGQYQGFAGMSFSLASILAPPLVALLCIDWGRPGWVVMGLLVLVAGVANVPATAWALRSRERYGVTTHSG